jgi:secreted trypsin-like serine protease
MLRHATSLILLLAIYPFADAKGLLAQAEIPEGIRTYFPITAVKHGQQATVSPPVITEQAKIVGGKDAERGQFKWLAALILSNASEKDPFSGFFCGGSLISWRWVLTAAHCTYEDNPRGKPYPALAIKAEIVHVYLGSHDFAGGQRVAIKRIVRHQDYDWNSQDNDLALLELEAEPPDKAALELMRLLPAQNQASIEPGRQAMVLGWGSTAKGIIPSNNRSGVKILQYVDDLKFKRTDQCNRYHLDDRRARAASMLKDSGKSDSTIRASLDTWYPPEKQLITEHMICAGTHDGAKDACFGDSGGPLVVFSGGPVQVGIVSWGPGEGCGLTNLYGVYVRLSKYLNWIADNTR